MNHDDQLKFDSPTSTPSQEASLAEPAAEVTNVELNHGSAATDLEDAPEKANDGAPVATLEPAPTSVSAEDPLGLVMTPEKPAAKPRPSRSKSGTSRPKKLRNLNYEEAFELLLQARAADQVQLYLRDGRTIEGAILFNDIKGTGRIINVVKEISVDFKTLDVRDIRFKLGTEFS